MQKFYYLMLLAIFTLSCGKKQNYLDDLKPTYADFENDWEQRNLFGKVKEIEWFKTFYQNDKKEGQQIITLKEHFTEFGSLKENTNYDNNGELIQTDHYKYEENQYLVKVISTNKQSGTNYILTVQHDTVNRTSTRKIIVNDSLNQEVKIFYNKDDYVVKQVVVENNDTTVIEHKYQFNDQGKILSETQIEIGSEKPIVVNQYTYNGDGNLIKHSYKTEWTEIVTETEWDDKRISGQSEYTILADSKKYLDQMTEFDKLFNPTSTKIYENSSLNRELKYEYEFDEKGNWIKREVSMKEHYADGNKFEPIYLEQRRIKYWE